MHDILTDNKKNVRALKWARKYNVDNKKKDEIIGYLMIICRYVRLEDKYRIENNRNEIIHAPLLSLMFL